MKLTDLQRDELLTALRTLQDKGPVDSGYGICFNLEEIIGPDRTVDAYTFVARVAVHWPGLTGRVVEGPVTGHKESWNPIARTYMGGQRDPLWSGQQLRMRKELIDFLIDWLGRPLPLA